MTTIRLADSAIGDGQPCLVVAEVGLNHCGEIQLAEALIDRACEAGARAVKFQVFTADELHPPGSVPWSRLSRYRWGTEEYRRFKERAEKRGAIWFATPFDEKSADLLEEIGVPVFKVGSGDVTHHRLLRHIGRKGKPVILSTGLSSLDEIGCALEALRGAGTTEVILLHCVSLYPTPPALANVRGVVTLGERFKVPVGLSDHTMGLATSLAAVALGACLVERHFTLSRRLPHLPEADNEISLEPDELRRLVTMAREVEVGLGTGSREVTAEERALIPRVRRSPYARRTLPKGHRLIAEDLVMRRPLAGIGADEADSLEGRRLLRDVAEGEPLGWDMLAEKGDRP